MKILSSEDKVEYLREIFSEVESCEDNYNFEEFCSALITLANKANSLKNTALNETNLFKKNVFVRTKIMEFAKELFFYSKETYLQKKCRGFHKLSLNFYDFRKKKNAQREMNHFLEKTKNNPLIKSVNCEVASTFTFARFGPYYFKVFSNVAYIDNCHLCSCPTQKITTIKKISVLDVFNKLHKLLISNQLDEEMIWKKIEFLILK